MKKVEDVVLIDFPAVIAEAENAVANVKNEHLRDIAFERILDHLLSPGNNQSPLSKRIDPPIQKSASAHSNSKTKPSEGTLSWLSELHEEGFFKEPKSLKNIMEELSARSHRLKRTDLTWPLQKLCHDKKIRRNKQEPAGGGREVFHWYNWK